MAAEQDPEFAAQWPAFVAAIQRLFPTKEIREYLDRLESTKFLAPPELAYRRRCNKCWISSSLTLAPTNIGF